MIAAYYFTPDSLDGAFLKHIVQEIIGKAESIGLYIHSITSDMGPVNLKMWRAFGAIGSNKYSKLANCIPHPIDSNRKLFFIADAPHLLKNLKSALLNNKVIELPKAFVNLFDLSSAIVECAHLSELVDIQENLQFKLIPKINKKDIVCTTFNKMKVNKATNLWSRDTSSAMKFYAQEANKNEFNTTAIFIEIVSKWFTLITARTPQLALGKPADDEIKEKKMYNDSIEFLEFIIDLFREIKIGHQPKFKPVQNGIITTTNSIIQLTKYLIHERGYQYVLAGRLTQDCIENIFSSIRTRQPIPNALQLKQNLKLLVISKFVKSLHSSNYDEDTGEIIGDLLNKSKNIEQVEQRPASTIEPNNNIHLNNVELNILYNIAGYIITSISKCGKICSDCIDSAGSKIYYPANKQYTKFVLLRRFRIKTLFFVNEETFTYFLKLEKVIRSYLPSL